MSYAEALMAREEEQGLELSYGTEPEDAQQEQPVSPVLRDEPGPDSPKRTISQDIADAAGMLGLTADKDGLLLPELPERESQEELSSIPTTEVRGA